MNEYEVELSETERVGNTFSCRTFTAQVFADNEDELRLIIKKNDPSFTIDKITKLDETN